MKKVLVICFTNLSADPRPYRQILNLKDKYEVTAVGFNSPQVEGVKFIQASHTPPDYFNICKINNLIKFRSELINLKLSKFENVYWKKELLKLKDTLLQQDFDLIIANDMDTLPFAVSIAKNAKIIFDAHEYSPKEFEDLKSWNFFYSKYIDYICKTYLPKVNKMLTVCEGIAQEYHKNYGILPELFTNASEYKEIQPSGVEEKIRIIYHGGANSSRKIENMIDMMDYLDDRFTLDLLMIGNIDYINKLIKRAAKNPKIKILPPIQRTQVCSFINKYDIGVYILEPTCFNNKYALPNKFFEYIQARLMLAIGPSEEMAKIVNKYSCGVVANSFNPEDLANKIKSLTKEDIVRYKAHTDVAAKELNAEKNVENLLKITKDLIETEESLICAE